jgi:hypothetical protein
MKTITRREWLRAAGRAMVFGGLGLLAAMLGRRAGPPARREVPCSGGGRCGACPALTGCELPRGQSARIVLGQGRRTGDG